MYDKAIRHCNGKMNGYRYFCDKKHPMANKDGVVYLHRHVASLKHGRWLTSKEIVHHIDGNRENNAPENLVLTTRAEHVVEHRGPKKMFACQACGNLIMGDGEKFCSSKCLRLSQRTFNVDIEQLKYEVSCLGYEATGRKYNVTGNAIKKRIKTFARFGY